MRARAVRTGQYLRQTGGLQFATQLTMLTRVENMVAARYPTARMLIVAAGVLALSACTKGVDHPGAATTTRSAQSCPLGIPGASVSAEDTPEGIALTFLAPDKVDELRERAYYAAAMHGPGARLGVGHDGHHGEGGDHGLQMMQLPPAYAGVDDIEGGARIRIIPAHAADLETLRAKARDRAIKMNASTCPHVGH